jgi:hypothetical protein
MGIRYADHVDTLYSQKLALTSPTSGGRSVGEVRMRTTGHGVFVFVFVVIHNISPIIVNEYSSLAST